MRSLTQEVVTKEAGIDLELEVSMEGETIIKGRADSLVGNFLRMLYGMMGEVRGEASGRRVLAAHEYFRGRYYKLNNSNDNRRIDYINYANPPVVDFNHNERETNNALVYLDTNVPEMTGWYYDALNNDHKMKLHTIDGIDRQNGTISHSAADWSALDGSQWNEEMWITAVDFQTVGRVEEMFRNPNIILGKNLSNKDSAIDDYWLEDPIDKLDTTGTTISEPAVQTYQSEITLSRTFTNNTNSDITVGEVGVMCRNHWNDYLWTLIARDNVSSFTISSGKSVTIDYTIKLTNGGGGGMMSQFHQQLYRQFTDGHRVVRDINNSDRNNHQSEGQWILPSTGGDVRPGTRGMRGQWIGPVPGTDGTEVSNTNTSLLSQIPHGEAQGELYYYGTVVEDMHTDVANNEVYFDVSRILENRTGSTITVSETALYSGYYDDDNREYPRYSVMTSRHVLNTPIDIPAGEFFKLTYRLKVKI